MKDFLLFQVKEFLKLHRKENKPLLLGLSGGGDSLALWQLLILCRQQLSFELHVAHVDHGWREESPQEAEILRQEAVKNNISFHLHTLLPPKEFNNLEDKARKERLAFFQTIYKKIGAEALLLAHHFDDQAETVLKRVFEGAGLSSLGGMKPISFTEGMQLWRPLLETKKQELAVWLSKRNLKGFVDKTNDDSKFLRARMRNRIFPELSQLFGKEVKENLFHLGEQAAELKTYIERKIQPFLDAAIKGPFGTMLDFNPFYPLERVELRALFKYLFKEEDVLLSRSVIENIIEHLQKRSANKKILFKDLEIIIDRGAVFFVRRGLSAFSFQGKLCSGSFEKDGLEWTIQCSASCGQPLQPLGWRDVWAGRSQVFLPHGEYEILPSKNSLCYPGSSSIKKWWGDHKVPAFLTDTLPLVLQGGKVVHEFFSGKRMEKKFNNDELFSGVNIVIEIKNK